MKTKLFSVTIHDCRVDTFTVGGAGGSGKDTANTGVRVVHEPSGAEGRCVESRSQLANKRKAFTQMAQSKVFQQWAKFKAQTLKQGVVTRTVDEIVLEEMHPRNLRVEYRTEKGWEVIPAEGE